MRTHGIRTGLLIVAGSLLLAGAAFAGGGNLRLDGTFLFEDDEQGDANEGCVIADGPVFSVDGQVSGTGSPSCTVFFRYDTDVPHKASASVLKSSGDGSAKVSQQVQTTVQLEVTGAGCADTFGPTTVFPEKCKTSGSVNADEPSEAVDKAKVSLTCELGEDLSEFGMLSEAVLGEIDTALSGRSDVKLDTSKGKLTIKTKGVQNSGDHSCT
jgi:hypothetical protein